MGARFTRREAETAFKRLVALMGGEIADFTVGDAQIGKYRLDYAAAYGGYRVERVANEHGGMDTPFGNTRRNAREFCDAVWFAGECVREMECNARAKQTN